MKLKELQQEMQQRKIDCSVFLTTSYNKKDPFIPYFSGIELEYVTLVVPKKKTPFLLVPEMEVAYTKTKTSLLVLPLKKRPSEFLKNYCKKDKTLGCNLEIVSVHEEKILKKLGKRIVDVAQICNGLRRTKTQEEIRRIKKACHITDTILQEMTKKFTFKTECLVADFLLSKIKEYGCEPAFPPIVASAKNSAFVHYKPQHTSLTRGFLMIDFGVKYKGYCSDITRMFFIGVPSAKEKKAYEDVLSVQKECIQGLALGKKMQGIDAIARHKLGKFFCHSLGHGLGTEIHEPPSLGPKSEDIITQNMVFTIEPGIYHPKKFGIRIEDTVLMRDVPEILTTTTKKLVML